MPIKIAFISSKAYKNYISSITQNIEDIQLDFYIYEQPEESLNIVQNLKPCDALIIGGLLPFLHIEHLIPQLPMPCLNIGQDETSVATTLLTLLAKKSLELKDLSIDVIDKNFVTNILSDMSYSEIYPKILLSTDQDLYEQHLNLYNTNQVKLIITSVHHLYERFQRENIPVMTIIDSKTATIQKIENLKSAVLLKKSNENRATAGIIKCHDDDFEVFLHFADMIHANYKQISAGNYELYATSGALQSLLNDIHLEEKLKQFKKPFSIGFGYGQSFVEAMHHAKEAVQFAKENEIFLLNEQSELSGPYPQKNTTLKLKLTNDNIREMAEKTTLSALNLSKVMTFIAERQSHEFTAQDLADYLHVTRRTAERTIKKLLDHNYLTLVSSEMTYQKGRPRAVYTLK